MSTRFAGRTAIVTGASRGIGLAVAERLVADGARVVITGRKRAALDEAATRAAVAELAPDLPGSRTQASTTHRQEQPT
jgi:NAD(P)-dependent dehydrogenase (short-subunit alcohol dehydrogenase family)